MWDADNRNDPRINQVENHVRSMAVTSIFLTNVVSGAPKAGIQAQLFKLCCISERYFSAWYSPHLAKV